MGHHHPAVQHFHTMPGHFYRCLSQARRIQLRLVLSRNCSDAMCLPNLWMVLGHLARLQDLRQQQAPRLDSHARDR